MRGFYFLFLLLTLTACSFDAGLLDEVKKKGELVVLTTNSPTTWYINRDEEPSGPEYDKVMAFAQYLGVEAKFIKLQSTSEVLSQLREGKGDIAAAGLTVTEGRKNEFAYILKP